jgi:hypothetical protein
LQSADIFDSPFSSHRYFLREVITIRWVAI